MGARVLATTRINFHLLTSCWETGQPVVVTGDFDAEPSVIPVTAKALQNGDLVVLEVGFLTWSGRDS